MRKTFSALFAITLVAALVVTPSTAGAGKKKKAKGPVVVGTDDAGDFNVQDEPTLSPLGDVLGADLVEASIERSEDNLNFVIKVNQLQTVPEFVRYIWSLSVDGEYAELDGKFTNYTRGACDPTSGQCPPPRDPGPQPFMIRANCVTEGSLTTCEEVGIVQATFDTAENTITIPVPMDMLNAKPKSKITAGTSSFTSQAGGTIVAIASAFVSASSFPRDGLLVSKTFTVPK